MNWLLNNYRFVGWLPFALWVLGELRPGFGLWLASSLAGAVLALVGAVTVWKLARAGRAWDWSLVALMMSLSPFFLLILSVLIRGGVPTPD